MPRKPKPLIPADPAKMANVVSALESGSTWDEALARAGVPPPTALGWMARRPRGRPGDDACWEFRQRIMAIIAGDPPGRR